MEALPHAIATQNEDYHLERAYLSNDDANIRHVSALCDHQCEAVI
jgi:hypothetical protein